MRLTSPLTLTLLLACACSTAESGDTITHDTSSTTSPATTSTTATASTTATTTGEPTTTATSEPTSTGSTSTTATTDAPTTTTGTTDTTSEPGTTTGGSSTTDTGVTPSGCEVDADCSLHDDCCDCYGLPVGQVDPNCDIACDESMCSQLAVDLAVCRFGVCIAAPVDCDGSNVLCKAQPPECPAGTLPGVAGECWTGGCVPIQNCNAVPECGLCPADTMCVQKISKKQSWPSCEPVPAECAGEIDCECAGTFVCTGDFNICNDLGDNQLSCGCPAC